MVREFLFTLLFLSGMVGLAADPSRRFVDVAPNGSLTYPTDAKGNRVPDFSFVGYRNGEVTIPMPAASVFVSPGESLVDAVRFVSERALNDQGIRGVILLAAGRHTVNEPIRVRHSGVVIRGSGPETVIVARGTDRRAVISWVGEGVPVRGQAIVIRDRFVPCGATTLTLESTNGLTVGKSIIIHVPSSREWISSLGMDQFPSRDKGSYLDWKPGTLDQFIERTITNIDGSTIALDVPLTTSLDASYGKVTVAQQSWPGRIQNVGIENLTIESDYDKANPHDENHAWTGITVEQARDCWIRNVSFRHLTGSAVAIWQTASRVTVADCDSAKPIGEIGGERRETYLTCGSQTLFLRCSADHGRHDFATGHLAIGPNAFVHCKATHAHGDSGGIGSWATGTLFDNVSIDGGGLLLTNWETEKNGTGWASANSLLWQCSAPKIECRNPPGQNNWAIGVWGQFRGNGHWRQPNEFVKPHSLFFAQRKGRLGAKADHLDSKAKIPTERGSVVDGSTVASKSFHKASPSKPLTIRDGQLFLGGESAKGTRLGTAWWRGTTLPTRATEVGVGITRFVPGRIGPGFTDDLEQLTDEMIAKNQIVLEHHWGLWTDRRRDDHQMIRRIDGDVWAPFYELPWARSGTGQAWDGLSRYDLTKFNPWYFGRLKEFATLAERKGLVLVSQMYFQHNVLEAAAHWADFPWRPANCLQETGFPEPPEHIGGKRIFMAGTFYDVSHPVRRQLHTAYIRHVLDEIGSRPNVIIQLGEEYTGPESFVRFWLETIRDWQREKSSKVILSLSVPKDIQDAILADDSLRPLISIVNVKYWWRTADGKLYDPPSNQNLAPRQQLREWKGSKSRSAKSALASVREVKSKYPQMAVTVSWDGQAEWILKESSSRRSP